MQQKHFLKKNHLHVFILYLTLAMPWSPQQTPIFLLMRQTAWFTSTGFVVEFNIKVTTYLLLPDPMLNAQWSTYFVLNLLCVEPLPF